MKVENVHIGFAQFLSSTHSITHIEHLWNHIAIPMLEKPSHSPCNAPQIVAPVVEHSQGSIHENGGAKVNGEIGLTKSTQSRIDVEKKREIRPVAKPPPRTDESPSVCEILNRGD